MSDTTVVLTACNRPDLLDRTLESFVKTNTYPIKKFIIIDDGLIPGCNDFVLTKYDLPFILRYNSVKIGQVRSIDLAYSEVDTPYIFHMEEDWKFLRDGYIETSMNIMAEDPKIITVWLRSPQDITLQHPYSTDTYTTTTGIPYKKCEVLYPHGLWNGFTFNPSLKRIEDYNRVKPYHQLPRITRAQQSGGNPLECDISVAYAQLGYYAVTVLDQYIEHIGWGRHL